jgi:DNA-binding LacI/PurR family transcriptional regulator
LPTAVHKFLASEGIPVVMADVKLPQFSCVDTDDDCGTRQAMDYLLSLGHTKIAHLVGTPGTGHGDSRCEIYKRVLVENGIEVRDELIVSTNFKYESGYRAAQQLLQQDSEFTAVFAAGDEIALAAMRAFSEHGLKIPDDVSIVGYSGDVAGEYSNPPLTTICEPFDDVGKTAVDMLMRQIELPRKPEEVRLPTKLIQRQSCRKI